MNSPYSWEGKPSWAAGDIFIRPIQRASLRAWEPWQFACDLLFLFANSDIDDEHPDAGLEGLRENGGCIGSAGL